MRTRLAATTLLTVAGLVLISGCSAPSLTQGKERGAPAYDPFRAARVEATLPSLDLLQVVKSPPTRVTVPDLGIDMPVEPHGRDADGQMSLPDSPFDAGWYEFGSAPNSGTGNTIIAAHVDDRVEGVGPFAQLRGAQPGTRVRVTDAEGTRHIYEIVSVEKLDKGEVPWGRYFQTFGPEKLILVTCGGDFIEEIRNYTDNYIVTAEKVS